MSSPHASALPHSQASATPGIARAMWGIAILWFGAAAALGASGALALHPLVIGPFIVVPVTAFAAAFGLSPRLREWAFAFDTRALVFVQAVRMGGLSFLAVYAVGRLSGRFALWAGLLDCAVGLSAPFAAQYLTPIRTALQRRWLAVWMALGIADFLVAIPLARISRSEDPAGMAAMNALPLSMITTWAVPLALIAYFLLGAHAWRDRGRA